MPDMADVHFVVHHRFEAKAKDVWDELVDWAGHAKWIPATRVEVAPGDPLAIGAEFTAWTGVGPLALKDHMRVGALDWNEDEQNGSCTVEKLGPILKGTAGFTVAPTGDGAELEWIEDVSVPYVPQFLSPIVGKLGAAGFKFGMRNLGRGMRRRAL